MSEHNPPRSILNSPAKCTRSKNPQLLPALTAHSRAHIQNLCLAGPSSAPASISSALLNLHSDNSNSDDDNNVPFRPRASSTPLDSETSSPKTNSNSDDDVFKPITPPLPFGLTFTVKMPDPPNTPRAKPIDLPLFESKPNESISDYIHTFTRIKKVNGWDDELALNYLKCNLRGYAGDWLRRYEESAANAAKTLPDFLSDLKSSLRAKSDSHMAERELFTRLQKKGENVRTYVCDMLRILERMDPDMKSKRKINLIKNNMREELVEKVGTPDSIEELIDRAEEHTVTKLVLRQRKKFTDVESASDSEEIEKQKRKDKKKKKVQLALSSSSSSSSSSSDSSSDEKQKKKEKRKKKKRASKKSVNASTLEQIVATAVSSALHVSHIPPNMVPANQQIVQPANFQFQNQQNSGFQEQQPQQHFQQPNNYNGGAFNRGRGHGNRNNRGRGGYNNDQQPPNCHFCGKRGHAMSNCYAWQRNAANPQNQQQFAPMHAAPQQPIYMQQQPQAQNAVSQFPALTYPAHMGNQQGRI